MPKKGELLFLNVLDPSSAPDSDFQKLVRSHVTKYQHRRRRNKGDPSGFDDEAEQISRSVLREDLDELEEKHRKRSHGKTTSKRPAVTRTTSAPNSTVQSGNESSTEAKTRRKTFVASRHYRSRPKFPSERPGTSGHDRPPQSSTKFSVSSVAERKSIWNARREAKLKRLQSALALAIRDASPLNFLLEDPTDTLSKQMKRLGLSVANILDHYKFMIDMQASDMEDQCGLKRGTTMRLLLPLVTTDYALLSSVALLCASHMRYLRGEYHAVPDMLRLKGFALSTIQVAFDDNDGRSITDQLIVAIMLSAGYEVFYGHKDAYHIHMKGLLAMIELRGGLARLGLDGLLEALVLWYDANTASVTGSEPYLKGLRRSTDDMDPQGRPDMFALGVKSSSEEDDDSGYEG